MSLEGYLEVFASDYRFSEDKVDERKSLGRLHRQEQSQRTDPMHREIIQQLLQWKRNMKTRN